MTSLTSGRTAKHPVRDASDPPLRHHRLSLKPLPTVLLPLQVTRLRPRVPYFVSVGPVAFGHGSRADANLAGMNVRSTTWLACEVDGRFLAGHTEHPCGWFAMETQLLATFPAVPRYLSVTRSSGGLCFWESGHLPLATRVVWDETGWKTTRGVCKGLERL